MVLQLPLGHELPDLRGPQLLGDLVELTSSGVALELPILLPAAVATDAGGLARLVRELARCTTGRCGYEDAMSARFLPPKVVPAPVPIGLISTENSGIALSRPASDSRLVA